MPEAFWAALAEPGLPYLALASLMAGLVYGFAGFGAALIFIPFASLLVPPAIAVAAFSLAASASLVTVVPAAWRAADRRAVVQMILACLVATPLGVLALRLAPVEVLQMAIGGLTLLTLGALLWGLKVPVGAGWRARMGIGALAGLSGGATGLNGPPVILFNLGSDQPVAVTRGNLTCFLTLTSLSFLPQLWLQGVLPPRAIWLGLLLLVPYAVGTWGGARLFIPRLAGFYRGFAYALIGVAGLAALPVWR